MEAGCKGDWYQTILKHVEFIREVKNYEIVRKTDKKKYKKLIQKEVEKAAIPSYIRRKENKLTQLDDWKQTIF